MYVWQSWMGKPVVFMIIFSTLCTRMYSAIREPEKTADYGWGGGGGKENEVSVSTYIKKRKLY
jgi:hypothetical protein